MTTEIHKGTIEKKIKNLLKRKVNKKMPNKSLAGFFGKLPNIEDGLIFQKKVRSE